MASCFGLRDGGTMIQRALQFDAPTCRSRGVLIDTPGGDRVSLSALHVAMNDEERSRWWRSATNYEPPDEFGYLPKDFEEFLCVPTTNPPPSSA